MGLHLGCVMPVRLGNAVDENMQSALFALDALDQPLDFVRYEMVDPNCDAAAAGLVHQGCGLFDGLRPVHFRSLRTAASPGDVDGGAGRAQLHGDAASPASRRAGHQRHFACQ